MQPVLGRRIAKRRVGVKREDSILCQLNLMIA